MKLEVGKTYMSRDGSRQIKVLHRVNGVAYAYPFVAICKHVVGGREEVATYAENGSWSGVPDHERDITMLVNEQNP